MSEENAVTTTVTLNEQAMAGGLELILVGALVLVAVVYLWRTWFGRRRSACSSCASGKTCAVARQTAAIRRAQGTEPGARV